VKHVFNVSAILIHDTPKKAIVLEWLALSQRFTDKSIGEWRRRFQSERWSVDMSNTCFINSVYCKTVVATDVC